MELTEKIETLNKSLRDLYGIDTSTGRQMWRISWVPDQFEKRYGTFRDFTSEGLFIREVTEVREVPKYRQWVGDKYILEHLVAVPEVNLVDLPTVKMSYEMLYIYETQDGKYLPPDITITKLVISLVETAQQRRRDGLAPIKKFFDEEFSLESSMEAKEKRINNLMEQFYGDESGLLGTTITESGNSIIVPKNYGEK